MTPTDLFASALMIHTDARVCRVDLPLARQAIELQISIGGDVEDLFRPYCWAVWPTHAYRFVWPDYADQLMQAESLACWALRKTMPTLPASMRSDLSRAANLAEQDEPVQDEVNALVTRLRGHARDSRNRRVALAVIDLLNGAPRAVLWALHDPHAGLINNRIINTVCAKLK